MIGENVMFSYSKFEHDYTKSLFKHIEPVSGDYSVMVNGEEVTVYTCRISKDPFNCGWPGYQRSASQTDVGEFPLRKNYDKTLLQGNFLRG